MGRSLLAVATALTLAACDGPSSQDPSCGASTSAPAWAGVWGSQGTATLELWGHGACLYGSQAGSTLLRTFPAAGPTSVWGHLAADGSPTATLSGGEWGADRVVAFALLDPDHLQIGDLVWRRLSPP